LDKATAIDRDAFFGWQDLSNRYAVFLPSQATISYLPLTSFVINNSYPAEDLLQALDPALLDEPFNGRFLCNVLGCESTFTRLGDRNRHVESKHNVTLHFCLVPGCEKSFARGGKGYTRKDKLQEHMQRKHAALVKAAV
jgi:hypothetical protein